MSVGRSPSSHHPVNLTLSAHSNRIGYQRRNTDRFDEEEQEEEMLKGRERNYIKLTYLLILLRDNQTDRQTWSMMSSGVVVWDNQWAIIWGGTGEVQIIEGDREGDSQKINQRVRLLIEVWSLLKNE